MKARLPALAAIALIGFCALVAGCGGDDVAAPTSNEAPILPPQNVAVSLNAYGEVMISWDRNTQSTLRGYNVYRHDVAESAIGRLTTAPIPQNHYLDCTATQGKEYEYRVTSVSTRGDESVFVGTTIQVQTPDGGSRLRPQQ
jgi:hypothetical protein